MHRGLTSYTVYTKQGIESALSRCGINWQFSLAQKGPMSEGSFLSKMTTGSKMSLVNSVAHCCCIRSIWEHSRNQNLKRVNSDKKELSSFLTSFSASNIYIAWWYLPCVWNYTLHCIVVVGCQPQTKSGVYDLTSRTELRQLLLISVSYCDIILILIYW